MTRALAVSAVRASLSDRHARASALVRFLIIAGVLGASALVALVVASGRIDLLLVAGATLAGVAFLFWLRSSSQNNTGLLAIAGSAGLLNFFTLPTGSGSRLVLSLVITLGIVLLRLMDMVVVRKSLRLAPSPLNAPVLAWAVVNIVSFGWSTLLRDPLVYVPPSFIVVQSAALLVNILLPLLILLVTNTVTEMRWLRFLIWLILGIGAFAILSELLGLPTWQVYFNGTRGLFGTWVVTLSLALALFDDEQPFWRRALLAGLAALWAWHFLFNLTVWLSGWFPMVVAVGVLLFFRSKPLFLLLALAALGLVLWNFSDIYLRVVIGNLEEGSGSRLDIWATAMSHVVRHPLLGMGPAGYAVYNMTYNPLDARSTHNNFFDITAQTGFIGLGFFLWLLAVIFFTGLRTLKLVPRQRGFAGALAAAVLAGTVAAAAAMMLGDWVLPFAYNQTISGFDNAAYTWLLFGAGAALYGFLRAALGSPAEEATTQP